jgi:hypothetical protein
MSNVFYSAWLVRQGSLGWATHVARFANVPILAQMTLSTFSIQEGGGFQAFKQQYAFAYLETVNTPNIVVGGLVIPNPNKLTDNHAWLTTDHVTFQLQADGVVAASAYGLIHDRSSAFHDVQVRRSLDFAVHDEYGAVLGTHREVQLDGGAELDPDGIQERALARATAEAGRDLQIVPVDLTDIPPGATFSIDPRTRRPTQ